MNRVINNALTVANKCTIALIVMGNALRGCVPHGELFNIALKLSMKQ